MSGSLEERRLTSELLDTLPPDDPAAVHSRRDLRLVNALMFQRAIMARLFRQHLPPGPLRLLEIGAGDGAFMLSLARRLHRRFPATEVTLLDMAGLVTPARIAEFSQLGWCAQTVTADVFAWLADGGHRHFDAVSANLFLHHFEGETLRRLLADMAGLAPVFLATEPHRNGFALWSTKLLALVGCNHVTLHDAAASVRAGFAGNELTQHWPDAGWQVSERRLGPFTQTFATTRKPGP